MRSAVERPFEKDTTVSAEDPIVPRGDGRQVGRGERTNAMRRAIVCPADRSGRRLRYVARQHRLVFEAESPIQRASQRRGVQADRHVAAAPRRWPLREAARRGRFRARPDRRASSQSTRTCRSRCRSRCRRSGCRDRAETAGGGQSHEHRPVRHALIPAGRGAQPERLVQIARGQQPDLGIGRSHRG